MRLVTQDDVLQFYSRRHHIDGHDCFVIHPCQGEVPVAHLEVQGGGRQMTLRVPLSPDDVSQKEILGFAWDVQRGRVPLRYIRLLLYYGDPPYIAVTKEQRLSKLALADETPDRIFRFQSKVPELDAQNKPIRIPEIPEHAENSKKNFVIADPDGIVVFKMYKMGECICSIQAVPFFGPLISFAIGLAVLSRP
jgi:hypothetical protein